MNETFSETNSPLSRLLSDDNLTIMEGIIPYCPPSLGRVLAVEMKLMEIQKILTCFDDEPVLRACGFEEQAGDVESILRTIRNSVSEEKAKQIDTVLGMIRFSKMYQTYQEILQSHPELMKSQEDSGSNNDKMKTLLDFATKASGDNRDLDFSELLFSFLKK